METRKDSVDSFIHGTTFELSDKSKFIIMFSCQKKSTTDYFRGKPVLIVYYQIHVN